MAPGVLQTFKKHLKQQIYSMFDYEDLKEQLDIDEMSKIVERQEHINFDVDLYDLIPEGLSEDEISRVRRNLTKCYDRAYALTDRDTYQAMEALVANLNTMHSRCGAQVPFSSLNYGTDTSPEGRMVIKNLLLAEEAGLGDGETPIFPISIFKVKEGINYNPEDPNYDMLQLACRVTSLRLFPNFAFLDAPFNKEFYKPGVPESEVGYMGCVAGEETITYKISNNLFVENFKNAYSRLAALYGEKVYGESCYVDLSATPVTIYDSIKHSFVQIKKIIKNPNKNNWKEIRFSNGRSVLATSDHPFYIVGKGRTFAKDLVLGDKTLKSEFNFNVNVDNKISEDEAWLLGLILCDGNYNNNIFLSFGKDEIDIIEKAESVCAKLGLGTSRMYQERGVKGSYIDLNIKCGDKLHIYREKLENIFGGKQKINRNIPNFIYTEKRSVKMAFICGMIDADGYMSKHFDNRKHNTVRGNLGSTNKTLALQQMMLLETLGYKTKLYLNKYNGTNKYRYKVEFEVSNELAYLASQKKLDNLNGYAASKFHGSNEIKIINITDYDYTDCSYDVETESDMFDVSGIVSHNCRTRIMSNVYDKSREVITGRGNLSFTTINLPRLGIKHGICNGNQEADMTGFYNELDAVCDMVRDQLLERFKLQCKKKVKNFPFLMGAGVWQESEKLNPEDTLEKVLKHGSLTIGFIGLSECLIALTGKHHAESKDSQKLGIEIISHIRKRCDEYATKYKLNFSIIATPAEGLSGRFVALDKERFGIIPGVTDKDYYTNSNHVNVHYEISIKDKLAIEAPYHNLTNGGHIAYVELDGLTASNPEAIMQVVRMMHDAGIGYGAINHPVDRDPVCGYTGIIGDVCPRCGRRDGEEVPLELVMKYKGSMYHHYTIADKPNIFNSIPTNTFDVQEQE